MKKLIINADDVGISSAVNEAVSKALAIGMLTGVSLMPRGESFTEAVSILKEKGLKEVGVHFTLTEGLFATGYQDFALKYYKGLDRARIREELFDQLRKVKEAGFTITHLDSHVHIHMFPDVFKMVLELALENNIPYVRVPIEPTSLIF